MIVSRPLVVLIVLLTATATFAADPFGRASIEGSEGIVPGQQVHVVVDVFAPEFFTSPPQFPLFEVGDAVVTLSSDRAQNLVQTIDGIQYSGIRSGYVVVPERAGSFKLPSIDVDLGYSASGNPIRARVKIALPAFNVGSAPDQTSTPFAARSLTITQSFDRDPATLKVGDALVRKVVIFAEDTQAMLIPPLDLGDDAGVKRYSKPALLADGVEQRGIGRSVETGSSRTENIVYTTSSEGSFTLPSISYRWFDVDAHQSSTETLAPVKIAVTSRAEGDRLAPTTGSDPVASNRMSKGLLALLVFAAVDLSATWLLWRRFPKLRATVEEIRERRRNSSGQRLSRLRTVIRTGSDEEIYRELQAWSRFLGFGTMWAWVEAQSVSGLATQVATLERRLFRSRDAELDRAALASSLRLPKAARDGAASPLPPLNPTGERPLLRRLLR